MSELLVGLDQIERVGLAYAELDVGLLVRARSQHGQNGVLEIGQEDVALRIEISRAPPSVTKRSFTSLCTNF